MKKSMVALCVSAVICRMMAERHNAIDLWADYRLYDYVKPEQYVSWETFADNTPKELRMFL